MNLTTTNILVTASIVVGPSQLPSSLARENEAGIRDRRMRGLASLNGFAVCNCPLSEPTKVADA